MNITTFDHLLNEELFKKVKKEFLERDIKYNSQRLGLSDIEVDIEENEIFVIEEEIVSINQVINIDPETGEEVEDEVYITEPREEKLKFIDDFLFPEIEELSVHYKDLFVRNLNKRNLFSKDLIKGFSGFSMSRLNVRKEQVLKSAHLDQSIKDKLLEAIDDIYDFINNEHYQNSRDIVKKIPLKLNKNQVVTLFKALKENGLIPESKISKADLARLIEQNFTFFDSKDNTYKNIRNARKLENKLFGSIPEKSATNSLNQLEEIFQNKDFFVFENF